MKYLEVVAAVFINEDNKIYCTKRGNQGLLVLKWEFPGGKIEPGETHQEALIREIKEELDTDITVGDLITTVKHQYDTFHITLHGYRTKVIAGELILSEHIDSKWCSKDELLDLDWAEADIPIILELKKNLHT
jgi:8-oxo-dGTP diphosphatase